MDNPESVVETKISVGLLSLDTNLEGVSIILKTGKALDKKSTEINLVYKDEENNETISLSDTENAYEHVFIDAIESKKEFFVSPEEVLETWRILVPIQDAWERSSSDLEIYEPGSSI